MSDSAFDGLNEEGFFDRVKAKFSEKVPNLSQTLNIAIIGKVSAGKSSLINALLKLSRKQALNMAKVGAVSGVTRDLKIIQLDEKVCLIDSPGLDDIRKENSEVTKKFLKHIDVGIFVVIGSSDASQKKNLDDLKQHCDSIFVVLNKIDEWDDLDPKVLDEVIDQWKQDLGVNQIYPTCARGYDPRSRLPTMDIRGVYLLRKEIEEFLKKNGKDLLLIRHMAEKKRYAVTIISGTLLVVATEAFLPGSAVLITATQGVAITSLYYLYTGEILPSKTALALLPTFIAQSAGSSLFLFAKSFLPPTGVIDVVAAGIAVSLTLAILATVNHILSTGAKLDQEELLESKFKSYHKDAQNLVKDLALMDIRDPSSMAEIVTKFLGKN